MIDDAILNIFFVTIYVVHLIPFLLSEHKGTKNPVQFDVNGNNSVVKDCQESLYLTTDCKQYFPVFQMRFTKSAGVITRGDMG